VLRTLCQTSQTGFGRAHLPMGIHCQLGAMLGARACAHRAGLVRGLSLVRSMAQMGASADISLSALAELAGADTAVLTPCAAARWVRLRSCGHRRGECCLAWQAGFRGVPGWGRVRLARPPVALSPSVLQNMCCGGRAHLLEAWIQPAARLVLWVCWKGRSWALEVCCRQATGIPVWAFSTLRRMRFGQEHSRVPLSPPATPKDDTRHSHLGRLQCASSDDSQSRQCLFKFIWQ